MCFCWDRAEYSGDSAAWLPSACNIRQGGGGCRIKLDTSVWVCGAREARQWWLSIAGSCALPSWKAHSITHHHCATDEGCAKDQVNAVSISATKLSWGSPVPVGDQRDFKQMTDKGQQSRDWWGAVLPVCLPVCAWINRVTAALNFNCSLTDSVYRRGAT